MPSAMGFTPLRWVPTHLGSFFRHHWQRPFRLRLSALCTRSTLMAQPFDVSRLQTTGPALPLTQQEVDKFSDFWQSGFSVSQDGKLVFQSAADAPSRLVWYDAAGKELREFPEIGYEGPRFLLTVAPWRSIQMISTTASTLSVSTTCKAESALGSPRAGMRATPSGPTMAKPLPFATLPSTSKRFPQMPPVLLGRL